MKKERNDTAILTSGAIAGAIFGFNVIVFVGGRVVAFVVFSQGGRCEQIVLSEIWRWLGLAGTCKRSASSSCFNIFSLRSPVIVS